MEQSPRSAAEVRNPLLALPAMGVLQQLLKDQPALRSSLVDVLKQLGGQADRQAEQSWQQRKAPMAAYWRAVAVYARHVARALSSQGGRA